MSVQAEDEDDEDSRPCIPLHHSIMSELGGRLEPYLLLAKSARGAAAAKVVSDAVSAVRSPLSHRPHLSCSDKTRNADVVQTGVYVFSELLDLPSIQEVS